MDLKPARHEDLAGLAEFLAGLGLDFPRPNFEQFVVPRQGAGQTRVTTYLLRLPDGGIGGCLGCLDQLALVGGERRGLRWPMNFFLAPELRGQGLGKEMMRRVMDGAELGLVLGGNPRSIPVLERTGWTKIGELATYRFGGAPAAPAAQSAEAPPAGSLETRPGLPAATPWIAGPRTDGAEPRHGAPRTLDFLRFAFGGALAAFHAPYGVFAGERPIGYFVLSLRAPAGGEEAEITDFDAVPGGEAACLSAALAAARRRADEVVVHAASRRFRAALESLAPRQAGAGLPLFALEGSGRRPSGAVSDWHVTHGDHDRYRRWPSSRPFAAAGAAPDGIFLP